MREPLALIASALADVGFPEAPILKSELLQRAKPSSNSMAALRELCHAMVMHSRSEEHTSELQSLMRNSYAVLCLKKKQDATNHTNRKPHTDAPQSNIKPLRHQHKH